MAKKIYIAPSNQTNNRYYGGKTTEAEQCQAIGELTAKVLTSNGYEVKVGQRTQTLFQKASEARKWGADIYLSVHSNGANGKARGTEVWYYTTSAKGKSLAQNVYNQVSALVGNGRGIKADTSYIDLKTPTMPSVICEMGFHDNVDDATYIVNHHNELSNALAKGCINYFGGTTISTTSSSSSTTTTKPSTSTSAKINWIAQLQSECNRQGFSNQTVDGIAGKNTLKGCPLMKLGVSGKITKILQKRLISLGYSCGWWGADGKFGLGTLRAVKSFQKRKGLTVDGIVGTNTWRKLLGL